MPRTRTGRSSDVTARRRTNGGTSSISSIRTTTRRPSAPVPPYARDLRWATPARPRNDVFVVDIGDRYTSTPESSDDDPLLLTA
jgi:hypothetical protein